MSDPTWFGYERVTPDEKARRVRGVFDSVAGKYDLMNDLMSAGMHRGWKRFAVEVAGNLAGVVPLTQGNVGTFELAVAETLAAFGAAGDRALAYAVAAHLAALLATALTGLIAAWMLGLRRQDVFYLRADGADPAPPGSPEASARDQVTG